MMVLRKRKGNCLFDESEKKRKGELFYDGFEKTKGDVY